jgi:hypothetical protein
MTATIIPSQITSNAVQNELNGSYYCFKPALVNFTIAVEICKCLNATVLKCSSTEDNFIKGNYLMNALNGIWLSIYDFIGNETNVNYYTNKTLTYYNRSNIQLVNNGEPCVRLRTDGIWADTGCDSLFSVVCKLTDYGSCNCPSPPTTTTTSSPTTSTQTTSSTTATISKALGFWSEWSSWQICILEKKRKLINNTVETIRANISCDLICKLFVFLNSKFN